MIASNVDPFPAAELETNRSGHLTGSQLERFQGSRVPAARTFFAAAACTAFAILLLAPGGPTPNAWLRPLGGTGRLVVAFLLFRVATTGDSLTQTGGWSATF